ncbi:MAG TPA: hypothetical protein VN894_00260, partial [Polyangiaceae bacterium]|nr:hypothetical protein [Polyangiaceae bacterium]
MSLRSGKAKNRLSWAAVCLGGVLAFASALAGCVGGGDDNAVPSSPPSDSGPGDAHSSDGASGDAAADGHSADSASTDASGDATHQGGDATTQDGGTAPAPEGGDAGAIGPPQLGLATTSVDFGLVSCGAM